MIRKVVYGCGRRALVIITEVPWGVCGAWGVGIEMGVPVTKRGIRAGSICAREWCDGSARVGLVGF